MINPVKFILLEDLVCFRFYINLFPKTLWYKRVWMGLTVSHKAAESFSR